MIFDSEIKRVAEQLVHSRTSDEGTVIALPSLYPSGAPVTVRVSHDGHKCFVSDQGSAYHEAEILGATQRLFTSQARDVADQYGVMFDNHCFFAVHVDLDQVAGAIRIIGAASLRAVVATEAKYTEQNDRTVKEDFLDILSDVYGTSKLERNVALKGSSTHSWEFAGRLLTSEGPVLFDAVTKSPVSVFSAHAKFSDIAMLEGNYKGVIGVPSLRDFKTDYRNLLQQAANLIEFSADKTVFEKFGRVAA